MMSPKDLTRFWSKIDRKGEAECWLWLGSRSRSGYPILSLNSKNRVATRLMLALDGRAMPGDGYFACHSCDNPPCINPKHLWWGTAKDNMADCIAKGRNAFANKTICANGHLLTEENTYLQTGKGFRERKCRECHRIAGREWARRKVVNKKYLTAEERSEVRSKSWEGRRAKFGPSGHNGEYARTETTDAIIALLAGTGGE